MKQVMKGFGLAVAVGIASAPAMAQGLGDLDNLAAQIDYSEFNDEQKEIFCGEVRKVTDQLTEQLPIKIDQTTELYSATTIYVQGQCEINYQYMVSEKPLFEMLQRVVSQQGDQDVPMGFIQDYFGDGGEGFEQFKQGLRQSLLSDQRFANLVGVPFVVAEARYQVMGEHISDFSISFGKD